MLRKFFRKAVGSAAREFRNSAAWEDHMLLQGAQASILVRNLDHLQTLGDAEFRVFSQWGEDGIIEWIVSRLNGIPQSVVEFGVEDFMEANTRFLVQSRNWRALVMDGSAANMQRLKAHRMYWRHDISAVTAFIDRDNINELIGKNGFSREIGILSIDLDGNDYWIWEAINVCSPWVVIVEYNGVLGDSRPVSMPYDPHFQRLKAHASGLYFGTSVRALQSLGRSKGYTLLGSPRTGVNAFFVRDDLAHRFEGVIADREPHPSLIRDSRSGEGALTFLAGTDRLRLISHLPVVDVKSGETVCLGDAGRLYGPRWKARMGVGGEP